MTFRARHGRGLQALAIGQLILAFFLTSCSGGGGSSAPGTSSVVPSGDTGSVALVVTDAPSGDFDEIRVTVTRATLLGDGGSDDVVIFEGSRELDLLSLESESALFSLATDVPVGTYDKLRLYVNRVLLVRYAEAEGEPDEEIEADLPANGKIDLNPRGTFDVEGGETLIVQIDIDAKKSVHVVLAGKSKKYKFRPVVFVKILRQKLDGKLLRITGIIEDLDVENGTFRICPDDMAFASAQSMTKGEKPEKPGHSDKPGNGDDDEDDEDDDGDDGDNDDGDNDDGDDDDSDDDDDGDDDDQPSRRCLTTFLADTTAIYDYDANKLETSDLEDGDKVTVIGHLRFIPFGEDNGDDIVDRDEEYAGKLVLDAGVVELWLDAMSEPFGQITGELVTRVMDGAFQFQIAEGQALEREDPIDVEILEGAKIYNKLGEPLFIEDLGPGVKATLDAILFTSDTEADLLKTPLIIVDTESGPGKMKLSGTIVEIDPETMSFTLQPASDDSGDDTGDDSGDDTGDDTGDNSGNDTGDGAVDDPADDTGEPTDDGTGDDSGDSELVCVQVTDSTDIFLLKSGTNRFEVQRGFFGELTEGMEVDVFGHFAEPVGDEAPCFEADDILTVVEMGDDSGDGGDDTGGDDTGGDDTGGDDTGGDDTGGDSELPL